MQEQESTCCHCGCVLDTESEYYFDEDTYCEDCLEEVTVVCDHCRERIPREADEGNSSITLCSTCYHRYYVTCDRCGRIIPEDDAYYETEDDDTPYCYDCHRHNNVIHNYYYKPEPIFHGSGIRYFGVELEVDGAGEDQSNARRVLEIANCGDEYAYCKHDGSLDDGFEIVTHPMTLEFHEQHMPWNSILDCLKRMGYRSHQTTTCGLHVHVNRLSLGCYRDNQEDAIGRILYFVERNWQELVGFSRRTEAQLDQWASRYGFHESPKDILKHAKGGKGRYCSINLCNADTIEFRIFRGTLKYNTLIAALQLVNKICEAAVSFCDEEMQSLTWTTFVSSCHQPELIQYLKERRLYINDPIESEVEV